MITLTKDGIVSEVQTDIQASAFIKNGWKVTESVANTGSVSNQEEVAEPEKKKPGRKPVKVKEA